MLPDLPVPMTDFTNESTLTYIEEKTTENILPPSYSQLSLNKEEIVIFKHPVSTGTLAKNSISLKDLQLTGYMHYPNTSNSAFNSKNNIAFIGDSDDSYFKLNPELKVANEDKIINKINLDKISYLPLHSIRLSPESKKLLLFFKYPKNKELYLLENITETTEFDKKTKLSLPLNEITGISFDASDNIYVVGILGNSLEIYSLSAKNIIIDTENNCNWNLEAKLTVNGVEDADFSKDGLYLYVLANKNIFDNKQKTFSVYLTNNNFMLVAEVNNTTSYPDDIDITQETLIFTHDNKLTLKSLVNDIEVSATFDNKLTKAIFVPKTKNILLFSSEGLISLLTHNPEEKFSYYLAEVEKIDFAVKNAYFDSEDNNKLNLIVASDDKTRSYCCSFLFGFCGCGIIPAMSAFFLPNKYNCVGYLMMLYNAKYGASLGLLAAIGALLSGGIVGALFCTYCVDMTCEIYKCIKDRNITRKIELKKVY